MAVRRRQVGSVHARAAVERITANDLLQLRYGSTAAEAHVGALLVIDSDAPLALDAVRAGVAERIRGVPRLRQRLMAAPPGCGRPVWVDDVRFDVACHVTERACPAPGDERALLELTARLVSSGLPTVRPLWAATLVHGCAGGRTGLVLAFHHVLADGIGGLAVLAHLVDGAAAPAPAMFPRPAPTGLRLAVDAARSRLQAAKRLPRTLQQIGPAVSQLRGLSSRAPATSLNQPTGPQRRLAVARTELAAARATAHAHGGTVNDVVLAAVAGALHDVLRVRGEHLDRLVMSVPVSGHTAGESSPVRNQTGVIPVPVPACGPADHRLEQTARRTRQLKASARGATAVLLEPAFAALARLGMVHWFIDHQRRVNTFVTNLRGPTARLSFLGASVSDVIPVNAIAGNVSVAFGALSYAGRLTITVVTDPDVCPDVLAVARALQHQLDEYAGNAVDPVADRPPPEPDGISG